MLHWTVNCQDFPSAFRCFGYGHGDNEVPCHIIQALIDHNTRPFPERIQWVMAVADGPVTRDTLDKAFFACERVDPLAESEIGRFDPQCSKIPENDVETHLWRHEQNRRWIDQVLQYAARAYRIAIPAHPIRGAKVLMNHLTHHASLWEADAFPLDAMMWLKNRYHWTFRSNAWSLREQLAREARIVVQLWETLVKLAQKRPLLVIVNERTPTDYLTCALPEHAMVWNGEIGDFQESIVIYTGVKIASSEHRKPLDGSVEGDALCQAMAVAQRMGRKPVLVDFSRRRFPRAFLRVARFARSMGWGIVPLGKLRDHHVKGLPMPKSPLGLPKMDGNPELVLYDPWPISDPWICSRLTPAQREQFCGLPDTKPWQDDRIGARTEWEMDPIGRFQKAAAPWILPTLAGWVRADALFKSRLARFLPWSRICRENSQPW